MTPPQERIWREESLVAFENYTKNDDGELSDIHKEFLKRIADLSKTLNSPFKFEVIVACGISYMKGYTEARDKAHQEHIAELHNVNDARINEIWRLDAEVKELKEQLKYSEQNKLT